MKWMPNYRSLSPARRWMNDLLYVASKSPAGGGGGLLRVKDLAEARRTCRPLISWSAILMKAIALASRDQPEIRQAFMPLPWPHIYQHPQSLATFVVEREWQGEYGVFLGMIKRPNEMSLRDINARLREAQTDDIETVGHNRILIQVTRLPLLLRRFLWMLMLYGYGGLRVRLLGTFSVNSLGGRGVTVTQSFAYASVNFFYGPIGQDGTMPIQVFFDHRIMDGAALKRFVFNVANALDNEIIAELRAEADKS